MTSLSPRTRVESSTTPVEDSARPAVVLAYRTPAGGKQQGNWCWAGTSASVVTQHESDRPDEERPCLDREDALANAPDANHDAGLFKVPRVIA